MTCKIFIFVLEMVTCFLIRKNIFCIKLGTTYAVFFTYIKTITLIKYYFPMYNYCTIVALYYEVTSADKLPTVWFLFYSW